MLGKSLYCVQEPFPELLEQQLEKFIIWVPMTEQELGKSFRSFKGRSYLSLNPGIYLRRGKIKYIF